MFAERAHALRQTDKLIGIKAIIHKDSVVELPQTSRRVRHFLHPVVEIFHPSPDTQPDVSPHMFLLRSILFPEE